MAIQEGLTEKSNIGDVEKKLGLKRDNPGQTPSKPAPESASKGGKTFKIR